MMNKKHVTFSSFIIRIHHFFIKFHARDALELLARDFEAFEP